MKERKYQTTDDVLARAAGAGPPPPRKRWWQRKSLMITGSILAPILVTWVILAVSSPSGTNSPAITAAASPRASASPSSPYTTEQRTFISDARDQFNVGSEVSDKDLASVGTSVCTGAQSGLDRTALDLIPGANGMSVSGGGADDLVNLAISDMCPGSAPQPTWHTLARYSGSGNWNGPPFKLIGGSPEVKVAFSYSGNGDPGFGSDNFIADLVSSSDDLSIANEIAFSGGKVTRLYPDLSFGGSHRYHLEVMASGTWTFTVKEKY